MRNLILFVFVSFLFSCERAGFESDQRQIIAKDVIRQQLGSPHSFDVASFKQDTLTNWRDPTISRPISYTLDFVYNDATGVTRSKRGIVIFAPTGNAVLAAYIQDR